MSQFIVERNLPGITPEQLQAAGVRANIPFEKIHDATEMTPEAV